MTIKYFLENTKIGDEFRKIFKSSEYHTIEIDKDSDDELILVEMSGKNQISFIFDIEEKKYDRTTSQEMPENLDELLKIEIL